MSEELGKINLTTFVGEGTDITSLQTQINAITPSNQLISGGVTYSGVGLVYDISSLSYRIQGIIYSAIASQVTLATADPTNDRIDVIYVDVSGLTGSITGTPAINPVKPQVDASTQLQLTFVTVPAGATSPTISVEAVYFENAGTPTEWAGTTDGTVIFNSVADPYPPSTVSVETTSPLANGKEIIFTPLTPYAISGGVLSMQMKAKVDMSVPQGAVRVGFWSGGSLVGNSVELGGTTSTTFGFIGTDTTNYQLVAIDLTAFGILPSTVDELRIYRVGGGSQADFFLDNIEIQEIPTIINVVNSTSASTGLLTGGVLSVASAITYDISDGTGQVVTSAGEITNVSWVGLTGLTPLIGGSNLITFVGITELGAVVIQSAPFTPTQSRTIIFLGVVVHVNTTTIDAVNNEQQIAFNPFSSLYDAMEAIGFFNINGNVFSPNGANLNLDKSVGTIFKMGSNYDTDINNPHYRSLSALTALTFQYRFSNGANGVTGIAVDPDNLDDGSGGLTPVGNNQWSIQRIYVFTSNNVKIQRGVADYATLDAAIAGIATEAYVTEPSIAANGLLRGWLITKKGATVLNGAEALFLDAPKFGEGNAGATGAVVDLQISYDNSASNPEILTSVAGGALTIRRGSAADVDAIFEGQNGAGSNTFVLNGLGQVTTGIWQGTAIAAVNGGTGQTAYVIGDTLYASSTTAISKLAIGSVGQVLTVAGGVPTWATPASGGETLAQTLAIGNSTGANDIVMSTELNSFVCIVSDNVTTTNRTSLCFVDGGASQDTIALTNPDFYTIPATQTGLIGVSGAEIGLEYHLSQFEGYYTTIDSNGWRFWINGGATPAQNINLDPLVRIAMNSPNGSGFQGIVTTENLTAERTYTFQDASGTVAFLSDITGGAGWIAPLIPLGSIIGSGTTFTINGGGGVYLTFDGSSDDTIYFNDSLDTNIPYDGSNLTLRIRMRLQTNGGVGDTIGWVLGYQFVQDGVNSDIGLITLAQQNVDVSSELANINFTTDLGLMTGIAGADTILVTLERNSIGTGADTYSGNAEVLSLEWVKS